MRILEIMELSLRLNTERALIFFDLNDGMIIMKCLFEKVLLLFIIVCSEIRFL